MEPLTSKSPAESEVVMTQIILPPDANALDTAFGGKVIEWIDICGAIAAQRHCRRRVVTASTDDLHFHSAIKVGWVVTLKARVLATFRTSMEVGVVVTAEDPLRGEPHLTTSALLTFVAQDPDGSPAPVPPLALSTPAEHAVATQAIVRRRERLARRARAPEWMEVVEPRGVTGK